MYVQELTRTESVSRETQQVPPLGPVGTPNPMGISTKGSLYTYIHGTYMFHVHNHQKYHGQKKRRKEKKKRRDQRKKPF